MNRMTPVAKTRDVRETPATNPFEMVLPTPNPSQTLPALSAAETVTESRNAKRRRQRKADRRLPNSPTDNSSAAPTTLHIRDSIARRIVSCTVPKFISKQFRHYATARECIDYLTRRFNAPHQQLDEMPCGRVEEEAAAAMGPGKATTDHRTDGVSLATPASGPTPPRVESRDQMAGETTTDGGSATSEVPRAATAQPHEPQPIRQEGRRTQTTAGRSATTEVHRAATVQPQTTQTTCVRPGSPSYGHTIAHTQGVNESPATSQQANDTAADIADPHATCAEPTTPAGTSQNPPVEPLEPLWVAAGDEVGKAVETAGQTGGRTTEDDSATTEVHRAATVQPQTTSTGARPGSPSRSHGVAHHTTATPREPPAAT